jgi:hypothetical protein
VAGSESASRISGQSLTFPVLIDVRKGGIPRGSIKVRLSGCKRLQRFAVIIKVGFPANVAER